MTLVDDPKEIARREALIKKWQMISAAAGVALPFPVGDIIGVAGDMLDPKNRTAVGVASSAAGLLPGVPSGGARRMLGELSEAGKAAAKNMPPFEDQMKMARTILEQQKAARGPKKLDALFDAEKGVGAVPNNQDIRHLGSVQYLTPREYLNLAEPLSRPSQKSLSHIRESLASGKKLGQPTLTVDIVDGVPKVVNHDGRHRATVLAEKYGDDALIPVHVIGGGGSRELAKTLDVKLAKPQRESDEELARLLARADALRQQIKDRK